MRHKANAPTDLQEDVEHIHVCLLHLIKQDDAVRLVADLLRELATLLFITGGTFAIDTNGFDRMMQ